MSNLYHNNSAVPTARVLHEKVVSRVSLVCRVVHFHLEHTFLAPGNGADVFPRRCLSRAQNRAQRNNPEQNRHKAGKGDRAAQENVFLRREHWKR